MKDRFAERDGARQGGKSKSSKSSNKSRQSEPETTSDVPTRTRASIGHVAPDGPRSNFDLFEAVTEKEEEFRGEECVTVRVPGYIRESIERYQALQFTSSPPPLSVIGCAAVYGGVRTISAMDVVTELLDHRERVKRVSSAADGHVYNLVTSQFGNFPSDIIPAYGSGVRSFNLKLSEGVRAALGGLAGSLCIGVGTLSGLALCDMLRAEDSTIIDHRTWMDQAIQAFIQLCAARSAAYEVAVEMLEMSGAKRAKSRMRMVK
jgi:hypothetical protein